MKLLWSFIVLAAVWCSVSLQSQSSEPAARTNGSTTESRPNYDIVYVRSPRPGDLSRVTIPEVKDPILIPPGADLMLLHPDGSEEVLVAGGNGAIVDPVLSFDAEWVYYSKFHDQRRSALNVQRRNASRAGADILKLNLKTREIVQLTFQEWTPNTGAANWSKDPLGGSGYYLGYGIFNLGPCPLPDGRLMFTSSRNGFLPNKDYTFPNLQLFVMSNDGRNVEQIGHLNLGSALHPTILRDGRVMFSTYETQGIRDQRLWGLWSIWPDGRSWAPLMSAFTEPSAFHFQTQLTNGDIAVIDYYNQNNNGFGTLLAFPPKAPEGKPLFGSGTASDSSNPGVRRGIWYTQSDKPSHLKPRFKKYSFSPFGLYALTGFSHGEDEAASRTPDGNWAGKVSQPSGAPDNDVLVVWTPGPANDLKRPVSVPTYDAGIYLIRTGVPANDPKDLVLIKNDPLYNELQPRAVVPYRRIYGVEKPDALNWLPNDGTVSPALPAGTPFGIVGSSTLYKRDSKPGSGKSRFGGLDPFNTSENYASSNWRIQGADAGRYSNDEIEAVRILAMEPSSHRSYGPAAGNGFRNHANERLRILGEVPLRKFDASGQPIRDVDGNPDTSFLAKIPADVPFTFQTVDKNGLALNMSQTWHQLRPGEVRNDCGGCHAHSQVATEFKTTAAANPNYKVADLTHTPPSSMDVEYYRDIKPILNRSCVQCHSQTGRQEAKLVLDDIAIVNSYENTYNRLTADPDARYGIPPVLSSHAWRYPNASRYIRMFQSRRSLLIWKVFGKRLDGWTNDDFPTESMPGDAKTFPAGANRNDGDIDFDGVACPPPGSPVPPLSETDKRLFARWIDLGAPISSPDPAFKGRGWFQDDLRPTVTMSRPRADAQPGPLSEIRLGLFDYYSGLDLKSLSVKGNFRVSGQSAGSELRSFFTQTAEGVWTLVLNPPMTNLRDGVITVSVKDLQGNITRIERRFSILPRANATQDSQHSNSHR
jgi:Hydrazine synthase alpha subunit middle domain